MTIGQLIDDFYSKSAEEENRLRFDFKDLDHNEPCTFTKFNSFLIDQSETSNINKLVFKYPASQSFVLSLIFYRTIYNLVTGRSIIQEFNPKTFVKDQKIKIGSAVVLFKGFFNNDESRKTGNSLQETSDISKINYICMQFYSRKKNTELHYFPIKSIPFIERVSDKAKLSTVSEFRAQWSPDQQGNAFRNTKDPIALLKLKKAAKSETSVLITDVNRYKELIADFTINGTSLLDVINVSYFSRNGRLISLNDNTQTYPQIVLANSISDVYEGIRANEELELKYKYIYADLNYVADLDEDLDLIDEMISDGLKFYFFLPENKDFDLSGLESRDFNCFAWQPNMVSGRMVETNRKNGSFMLQNYRQNTIQPFLVEDEPYSGLFVTMHGMSKEIDEQGEELKSLYYSVMRLLFFEMRNCSNANKKVSASLIEDCENSLDIVKQDKVWKYLPRKDLADSLISVFGSLRDLTGKKTPKQKAIENETLSLTKLSKKVICFIVPGDNDVETIEGKLDYEIDKQKLEFSKVVVETEEQFLSSTEYFDYTIIVGWLNKTEMRKIFFSNKSRRYLPVLYKCEYRWFEQSVNGWNANLESTHDISFMGLESVSKDAHRISVDNKWAKSKTTPSPSIPSEENVWDDYHSKRFNRSFSHVNGEKNVDAIPIAFNDGTIGYYTVGFKLLVLEESNDGLICRQMFAKDIKPGMLTLMRDSSKDILEDATKEKLGDQADQILSVVYSWKRAIQKKLEEGFSDQLLIQDLKRGGIKISNQEFRIWLDPDNSLIRPGKKESLAILGKALGSQFILDNLDKIWTYASRIWGIHVQVGRNISNSIAQNKEIMSKLSEINHEGLFSKSLQMDIPSIGKVSVLKVTDIDKVHQAPRKETNRRR